MSTTNDLVAELSVLLNKHSAENQSDTPDFILAQYLFHCLQAFDNATRKRDEWYAREKAKTPDEDQNPITGGPG